MTVIFYAIAVFFFLLLIAFAGKVIIGGFAGASPEMFAFERKGSIGNQLFNTIYLVLIALVVSVPIGVCAGIYLAMYAKQGILTKFLRICIETLSSLPSIVVGLFGYLCVYGPWKKPFSRRAVCVYTDAAVNYNNNRGCHQGPAGRLSPGESWTWGHKVADNFSCFASGMYSKNYDRRYSGCRPRLW